MSTGLSSVGEVVGSREYPPDQYDSILGMMLYDCVADHLAAQTFIVNSFAWTPSPELSMNSDIRPESGFSVDQYTALQIND